MPLARPDGYRCRHIAESSSWTLSTRVRRLSIIVLFLKIPVIIKKIHFIRLVKEKQLSRSEASKAISNLKCNCQLTDTVIILVILSNSLFGQHNKKKELLETFCSNSEPRTQNPEPSTFSKIRKMTCFRTFQGRRKRLKYGELQYIKGNKIVSIESRLFHRIGDYRRDR